MRGGAHVGPIVHGKQYTNDQKLTNQTQVTRKIVLRHNLRTVGTVGNKNKWTGSRNGINEV